MSSDDTKTAHTHAWQPAGIITEDDILYSPVSRFDHVKVTYKIAVRSCKCGAIRRTVVGQTSRRLYS